MTLRVLSSILFLGVLVTISSGCAKTKTGEHPVYNVSGTVTYKNNPVTGAYVEFVPKEQGKPHAYGLTDAQGDFSLKTYTPGDGAVSGTHTVVVRKSTRKKMSEADNMDPNKIKTMSANSQSAKSAVPLSYQNETTSKLSVTVTASGENQFQLTLKDGSS